jgi:hypothetical protein
VGFLRDTLIPAGTIDAVDFQHLHVTDDPHEAVEYVKDMAIRKFGLKYAAQLPRARKRWWWLGE